ncbi:hypothetical protein SO802_030040 [Lithocarpus litseifolius]|uniref:non-specific serine/threonine protein kinase n=1 Tax=Lithocarpus litseifolius TaxID=425828 RepID=A0AAW2BWP8_9ROSI
MEIPAFFLLLVLLLLHYFTAGLAVTVKTNITTDQSAILALKAHITDDPYKILASNWSSSTSVCNWIGITCGAKHLRVTSLNLSHMGLTGTIAPQVGNLSFLSHLSFRNNNFHGSLPNELAYLAHLEVVSFGLNNFSGMLPSWLGFLPKLQVLYAYTNSFEGSIPESLGNISSLKVLHLSENNLSGRIPRSLGNCTSLEIIHLDDNNFSGQSKTANIVVVRYVLPAMIATILGSILIFFLMRSQKKQVKQKGEEDLLPPPTWRRITHLELEQATDGFSESNLVGKGNLGSVYKGTLSDDTCVAIKVFNLKKEEGFKSFEIECDVLCRIQHQNLVKIIGSCSSTNFKALVLEYMPKGSLKKWLYSPNHFLDMLERLNMMINVASSLEYLHHGCPLPVVHCDLKPSNILLNKDMVAHVSDFGISKLLGDEDSMTQTMTLATIGYMAPEYGSQGAISTRGDVYSYGILLMETFTRKNPTDEMFVGEMNLKRWVKQSLPHLVITVIDANLLKRGEEHFNAKLDCMLSIMQLAMDCSTEAPEERINMRDVITTLKNIKSKFLKDVEED